ncbi:MAG: hypothetical protein ACRDTF_10865 [Pseudonocardiaceae bacterium]
MSRHVWSANTSSDNSLRSEAQPQHLGIFAATVRALKGLTGRPAPARAEVDLPDPRPAPESVESPPTLEETTVELPRYVELEPTEPALAMLSRGRHSMW